MLRSRLLLLAPLLLLASPLSAGDWLAWRGPHGNGTSEETGVPLQWSASENVKWKIPLDGEGNSTPIIVGENLLIAAAPAKSTLRGLRCYNRNDGTLRWKREVEYSEAEATHGTNPYCSSSPVSDGKTVVIWHGSAGLFAYDLEGNELWRKDLGKVEHIWGFGSSPLIHDGLVILNFGPGLNAFVAAFGLKDGKEVWRQEFAGMKSEKVEEFRGSWSTPLVHKGEAGWELLLSLPERLQAVNPRTGKEIWSSGGFSNLVYTSPLASGDIVVAMCGYGGPAVAVRDGGKGDVTDSHRLWRHEGNPQRVGSGVLVEGFIYILNEPGLAWCLDAKTGEKKWEQRLGGTNSWSSSCYVDGRLYCTNMDGDTFVLEVTPAAGKILAENKIGETTRASLAFSNGQVFLRTYKNLYCFEKGK